MKLSHNILRAAVLAGAALLAQAASAATFLHDGNLGADYTHVVASQDSNGKPCAMSYNQNSGLVHWWDITVYGGDYSSPISSAGLLPKAMQYGLTGLTNIEPFHIGSAQYLMLYNYQAGRVYINRIDSSCNGSTTQWQHTADPSTRWTHFGSFYINGAPFLIAYNQASGAMFFDMVNAGGVGTFTVWTGNVGKGFTHLMTFTDAKNNPAFMLYNSANGAVRFNVINANAQGFQTKYSATWGAGWTHFVHSPVNGQFIAYQTTTGLVHFDVMKDDLTGYSIQKAMFWTKGVTQLAPFQFKVAVDAGNKQAIGGFVPYTESNYDAQVWLF